MKCYHFPKMCRAPCKRTLAWALVPAVAAEVLALASVPVVPVQLLPLLAREAEPGQILPPLAREEVAVARQLVLAPTLVLPPASVSR